MNELTSRQDMAVMANQAAGLANLKLSGSSRHRSPISQTLRIMLQRLCKTCRLRAS
ncbi:hypothetical protein [Paenibacillus sp. FJAT-27812]|uniref:hypothetical protein n=1 Tax=Paenibacillus sp. FJAT-27812 TaxID=1684143 RepID=UPI001E4AC5D7|nr:hypothetical protein [Paenibacillus sp. FJAT-27812]